MSGFEVIKAGVFTLVQDRGRYNYAHLGVTSAGSLDEYAALWAHKLLDNDINDNLLEIAFSNVELKSIGDTTISITGAYCEFFINGVLKPVWQSYNIKAGDTINIGKFTSGTRVYFAVKNGFTIKKEFGSNSTSIKDSLGGLSGNKLVNNDFLPFVDTKAIVKKRVREDLLPKYESELTLRVVLSYQESSFIKEEKEKFFNSSFTVTSDFNRMACKLKGEQIKSSLDGIVSEGISFGVIQIPKDGQPIILLKDRQTIGGYPKIGSVLSIDCFKLAQAKIGTVVRFEELNIEDSQNKIKSFYSNFF
ncbi:biotin-dependent carboxyltransferase family protein [Arcobacter sp. LA11]|uniref:5-oxoprolinase subunit C family protein n=1 Tax=Arcobacter sp. LA11 TaxID=1898176 RepID=UPI00093531E2|nr:biotin-dependent carboxyltransferase family protein [Arcobacter sp. LA11]